MGSGKLYQKPADYTESRQCLRYHPAGFPENLFLRFLYSDESVSAFAEASGALYATKSAREVAKDKLSTAIYNMYGIYDEANASSLIMSFSAVPADCKINPKDEIFNPITSVMNDEMTVEEWAQNVEDAFAQVRADQEAAK